MGTDWARNVCSACQTRTMVPVGEQPPLHCPDCGTYGTLAASQDTASTALTVRSETAPTAPSVWEDLKQAAIAVAPHVARGAAIVGAQLLRYKVQEMAERKRAEAVSNHQWAAVSEVARNVGPVAGAGALLGAAAGYLTEGPTGAVRGAVEGGKFGCEVVDEANPDLVREPLRRHAQAANREVQSINALATLADGVLSVVQAAAMGGANLPTRAHVSDGCCPRCGRGAVRRFARGAPGGEYVCNLPDQIRRH